MGKSPLPDDQFEKICDRAPVRKVFDYLGIAYDCIDVDGHAGAVTFDLNFDTVPDGRKGKYDLTCNIGTTEHLINQVNAFRVIHDFTKVGGLMLHIVPYLGAHEHGFFNYQPNFFGALARFNGYETLGIWINPGGRSVALIPYQAELLDVLKLQQDDSAGLFVLLRRQHAQDFQVPFQGFYEYTQKDDNLARYNYVVDGELLAGRRVKEITQRSTTIEAMPGSVLLAELTRRLKRRLGIS
jgi:hypothetical protein